MEQSTHFIGESPAFLDSVERASRAAALNRPVLVIGERGTGKELVAERLHRLSQRWDGPLITMNCAALTDTLIEAELFGHEAGAFTGATRMRAGRFEEADGGTLFLDELATLSSSAQERLLRAVEYGEVTRIGTNRPIRVDVRIVAATNEHLPGLVDQGRFRADLLDRLAFEVITLPPLRAREGDIAVLAEHFGRRMATEVGWSSWPGFTAEVMSILEGYDWPGNIRELRSAVERAVYRWDAPRKPVGEISLDPFQSPWLPNRTSDTRPVSTCAEIPEPTGVFPTGAEASAEPQSFKQAVADFERRLLERALDGHRHNQRRAAAALGLSYDQLRHAMRKAGLL